VFSAISAFKLMVGVAAESSSESYNAAAAENVRGGTEKDLS
jgi:hypothetical protein